jgi:uncharacterized membrane protein YhhN
MYAWVLLAAAAAAAVADWFAVATRRRALEQVAKPAYVVLLSAFAWLLHAEQSMSGMWLLTALALCLLGDVLLLADSDQAFGFGLVTFLLAHVAFIGAVLAMERRAPIWAGVAATVVVVLLLVALVFWPMARRDVAEGLPPTLYALVLWARPRRSRRLTVPRQRRGARRAAVLARFSRERCRCHGDVPRSSATPRARNPPAGPRGHLTTVAALT